MKPWQYFDRIAPFYDQWFASDIGRYIDLSEKREVFSLIRSSSNGKNSQRLVLDVGCGTGGYTLALRKAGLRVVGLDASEAMLKIARRKLQANFVRADALSLPFKNEVFDGVLSITLFEFIFNPEVALKEIYRVLKPEGEIIIGTMNGKSLWFIFKRLKSMFEETAYRYARFYTPNQLKELLIKTGFKDTYSRGIIYLPSFVPRALIPLCLGLDKHLKDSFMKHLGAFVLVKGIKR